MKFFLFIWSRSEINKLMLKAMCEYVRRGQTSDFKLLNDAKFIQTVRVEEVESLPKAIFFPCDHRKIVRLQNQNKL